MRFSIITICYNPGENLRTAIDSVLGQDYSDIEYIIIDGASTDGTVNLIQSYGKQISTFISEPDKGLYDALNKGVKLATGDCIGFVHADDMLASPMVLSNIAAEFAHTRTDCVYGDLEYVARDNPDKTVRYWQSGQYYPSRLKFGWMPPHPALYVRRKVYDRAKLADGQYFDTSFSCAADYDFMMRILQGLNVSVAYLPVVLVKMRVGGVSNRSLSHIIRKSREDYIAMKRNNIGRLGTLAAKNLRKIPQFAMMQRLKNIFSAKPTPKVVFDQPVAYKSESIPATPSVPQPATPPAGRPHRKIIEIPPASGSVKRKGKLRIEN